MYLMFIVYDVSLKLTIMKMHSSIANDCSKSSRPRENIFPEKLHGHLCIISER